MVRLRTQRLLTTAATAALFALTPPATWTGVSGEGAGGTGWASAGSRTKYGCDGILLQRWPRAGKAGGTSWDEMLRKVAKNRGARFIGGKHFDLSDLKAIVLETPVRLELPACTKIDDASCKDVTPYECQMPVIQNVCEAKCLKYHVTSPTTTGTSTPTTTPTSTTSVTTTSTTSVTSTTTTASTTTTTTSTTTTTMDAAGYKAQAIEMANLKEALDGMSAAELLSKGFTVQELYDGGFAIAEIEAAGDDGAEFQVPESYDAQYSTLMATLNPDDKSSPSPSQTVAINNPGFVGTGATNAAKHGQQQRTKVRITNPQSPYSEGIYADIEEEIYVCAGGEIQALTAQASSAGVRNPNRMVGSLDDSLAKVIDGVVSMLASVGQPTTRAAVERRLKATLPFSLPREAPGGGERGKKLEDAQRANAELQRKIAELQATRALPSVPTNAGTSTATATVLVPELAYQGAAESLYDDGDGADEFSAAASAVAGQSVYASPSSRQMQIYDDGKVPGAADHFAGGAYAPVGNDRKAYGSISTTSSATYADIDGPYDEVGDEQPYDEIDDDDIEL
eukprot:gene4161-19168_t